MTIVQQLTTTKWVRVPLLWLAVIVVFYVALQQIWPTPAGVVVQGVIIGSFSALLAIGLTLVYRSNRVINFAQADLGAVPAALCVALVAQQPEGRGWSFWFALPIALVAAVLLGSLVERLVIRHFSRAPRLVLMVVTIGLAQVLAGLASAVPFLVSDSVVVPPSQLPQPFAFSFSVHPYVFHANDLVAVIVTAVCTVALFSFLRYSNVGIAMRAGAENAERASLLGVNVGFTQNVAWMIAAFLSAITLVLRAGTLGLPLGGGLGPAILVRALAAAVIGKMDRLSVIFAAAVGIGIVETAIIWNEGSATLLDPALFAIVVGALLLQRRNKESRVDADAASSWPDTVTVRPVPRVLARLPEVRWARRGLWALVTGIVVLLPWVLDDHDTNLAAAVAIYAIVAVSLVLLTGWAGEISLGQVAFVAIGSATAGALNVHYQWGPLWTFLAAGIVGGAASVIIGLPALRIRGIMLAVTTMSFAVMTSSYLLDRRQSFFGLRFSYLPDALLDRVHRYPLFGIHSVLGLRLVDRGTEGGLNETGMYLLCLAALGALLVAMYGLQRWRTARVLIAMRENERAAQSFGASPTRAKLLAFAVSGFVASFAGGMLALHQNAVGTTIFAPIESIRALTMVVVGGLGSLPGAVLGAVFLKSTEWFNDWVPEDFRFLFTFALSGAGLVAVLWFLPGGLGSLLTTARDAYLRAVARRRGVQVPALESAPTPLPPAAAGAPVAGPTPATPRAGSHATDPPVLSVEALAVGFGRVQVVTGVDFAVDEGETLALVGTNGAGKSTVLRALSGLVEPNHVRVCHRGVDITGWAPHRIAARGIIHVPGGRGVFPSLTVSDNLRVAAWTFRRDRARVADATARVLERFPDLRPRLAEPAAALSGGQQQMLALAMGLLAGPSVLLVDELSLGLAPIVVQELLGALDELEQEGVTVVLVEQSVDTALAAADTACFMERGTIRFSGSPAELAQRDDLLRSVFVAGTAAADAGVRSTEPRREPGSAPGEDAPVVIEVQGLTKHFAGITALDDVTIALHAGEIVGVIGPNGAGKTTLFDAVSGFVVPDAGRVVVDGRDVTTTSPAARARSGLARSFQDARLFGALTAHQTVCVALDRDLSGLDPLIESLHLPFVAHAQARLADQADTLLETMGLGDFRDRFVSELSTGTRRLLDLTCQLGRNPRVLLLDEPSAGIAQREAEALAPVLQRVRDETGASLLVIEHDLTLVTAVAERIVAMDLGRVIATGDAATVLDDPRVVASYLGSSGPVLPSG